MRASSQGDCGTLDTADSSVYNSLMTSTASNPRYIENSWQAREAEAARLNGLIEAGIREVAESFGPRFEKGRESWAFQFSITTMAGQKVRFNVGEVSSGDLSRRTARIECHDLYRDDRSPRGGRNLLTWEGERFAFDDKLGKKFETFIQRCLTEFQARADKLARGNAIRKTREERLQKAIDDRGLAIVERESGGTTVKGAIPEVRASVGHGYLDIQIVVRHDRAGALLDALVAAGFIADPKAGV
jgi:hypothetical protein